MSFHISVQKQITSQQNNDNIILFIDKKTCESIVQYKI